MERIGIIGGTGLVGRALANHWRSVGHDVRIFTRKETVVKQQQFHFDMAKDEIDEQGLIGLTVLVNLAGEGIAEKRWTDQRIKDLYNSRIDTATFFAKKMKESTSLKHYISASGVNAYGYDSPNKLHTEEEPFGKDVLSDITKKWEQAADLFLSICKVAKLRIAVVLSKDGGALVPISKPMNFGMGCALGSGNQNVPWIHLQDLVRVFDHTMLHNLEGSYNSLAGNNTNNELTKSLAKTIKKRLWLPNAPAFMLKLILGKMSTVVLDGLKASNEKLIKTGFKFEFKDLKAALEDIYK